MGRAIWALVDKILTTGQSINDRLFNMTPDSAEPEPFTVLSGYYDDQPYLREMYLDWLEAKSAKANADSEDVTNNHLV